MRRSLAVLLVVVLMLAVAVPPAQACIECVALGLASFAVFTQLVSALTEPRVVYTVPGYSAPGYYGSYGWSSPTVYAAAAYYYPSPYYAGLTAPAYPATYASVAPAPAWTGPRVVQYAHGRYELRGDGISVPYVWVWIPIAAAPAPPPTSAPAGSAPGGPAGGGLETR